MNEEFKLDPQSQKESDEYFADRDLMRNDFEKYISLKKDVVKQNFLNKKIVGTEELDFVNMLGDSIKEKYESLAFECIRIKRHLKHDYEEHYGDSTWICGSPEVVSIFQTVTSGFNPTGWEYDQTLNYTGSLSMLDTNYHILKEVSDIPRPEDFVEEFYVGHGNNCIAVKFNNFII